MKGLRSKKKRTFKKRLTLQKKTFRTRIVNITKEMFSFVLTQKCFESKQSIIFLTVANKFRFCEILWNIFSSAFALENSKHSTNNLWIKFIFFVRVMLINQKRSFGSKKLFWTQQSQIWEYSTNIKLVEFVKLEFRDPSRPRIKNLNSIL